jgi:hypothetical protein
MLNCRGKGESNSARRDWFRIHKHISIAEATKGNHHKVQFPIRKNNALAITGLQNHRVRTNKRARRARLPQQSFNAHNGNWNFSFEIYLKITLIEIVLTLFTLKKYTGFKCIVISLYLALVIYDNRRSQWPRGVRHELSSLDPPLGSWVRIPVKVWKFGVCMRLFCVCLVLCLGSGLVTGWSLVQGVLPTVKNDYETE